MDKTTVLITTHMQQLCTDRWRNCVVTEIGKDSTRRPFGSKLRLKLSDQSLCEKCVVVNYMFMLGTLNGTEFK